MADKKRSYLNPEFELEVSKEAAEWNWDLAKRKVKKHINQFRANREAKAKKKKEPGLGLGRTADLLKEVDD